MTAREAGLILTRLKAHFPSIAADDVAARSWLQIIQTKAVEVGMEACEKLINGAEHAPRPAEWHAACRQVALYAKMDADRRELEAPPVAADVGLAGVGLVREALSAHVGYETPRYEPSGHVFGPCSMLEPALEYGQVYDEHGRPRAEYAAEVERWRRIR